MLRFIDVIPAKESVRRGESLKITRKMRPDLFEKVQLTKEDRRILSDN